MFKWLQYPFLLAALAIVASILYGGAILFGILLWMFHMIFMWIPSVITGGNYFRTFDWRGRMRSDRFSFGDIRTGLG